MPHDRPLPTLAAGPRDRRRIALLAAATAAGQPAQAQEPSTVPDFAPISLAPGLGTPRAQHSALHPLRRGRLITHRPSVATLLTDLLFRPRLPAAAPHAAPSVFDVTPALEIRAALPLTRPPPRPPDRTPRRLPAPDRQHPSARPVPKRH